MPPHRSFQLKTISQRICFAAAGLLLAAVYVEFCGREFRAARAAASNTPAGLARAVRMEPSDAGYHNRLGHVLEATLQLEAAAQQYQAALRLNPHVAQYWLDEATLYDRTGDVAKEQTTIENALRVDPRTPDIAWRAANFYLVGGKTSEALRHFRTVLEGDPDMAPAVLDLAWRATHDADRLLAVTLPDDPLPQLAFLDTLIAQGETGAAKKVWMHLVGMRRPFEARLALPYIDYLIEQKEITPALDAWDELATLDHKPAYGVNQNLVINGGFDAEILNAGFDWRYYRQAGVQLSLDATVFHGGHRSLEISFEGPGMDEVKIFHFIPLSPDTSYDFSGYFKTGDLEGAGGPRIAIIDADNGQTYFTSDDLKNAEVWRQVSGTFSTGPKARLAVLKIIRVPEGDAIRGSLWLDDLELTKK